MVSSIAYHFWSNIVLYYKIKITSDTFCLNHGVKLVFGIRELS